MSCCWFGGLGFSGMVVCVGFGLRSAGGLYLHALVCRLGFRFLAVRRGLADFDFGFGFWICGLFRFVVCVDWFDSLG